MKELEPTRYGIETVIKLYSDNFEGALMSWSAYKEVRLQMSTGDFHTHRIEVTTIDLNEDDVLTLADIIEE